MEPRGLEAAKQELDKAEKEVDRKSFDKADMALVEHIFSGGTELVDGEPWGMHKLFDFLDQEKSTDNIQKKICKPVLIPGQERALSDINEHRLQKKRIRGMISVFDVDQQVELGFKHIEPYIELGEVGGNGQVSGEWRVGLIDGSGNEIDSSELKLDPDFSKYFTLEKDTSSKNMILKLNLQNTDEGSRMGEGEAKKETNQEGAVRVLLVEDDKTINNLLHDTLEGTAQIVGSYESVQQTLEMFEQSDLTKIDLLIVDWKLKDDSEGGMRIIKAFRGNPKAKASIIMLTADPDTAGQLYPQKQREELGFKIMRKPFSPADLITKVEVVKTEINKHHQS